MWLRTKSTQIVSVVVVIDVQYYNLLYIAIRTVEKGKQIKEWFYMYVENRYKYCILR